VSRGTQPNLPAEWHGLSLVASVSRKLMACRGSYPPRWVVALSLDQSLLRFSRVSSTLTAAAPVPSSSQQLFFVASDGLRPLEITVRRMTVDITS
jgi:hypothetical protein